MAETAPDFVALGLQEAHPQHVPRLSQAAAAALRDALPGQRFVQHCHEAQNSYTPLLLFERVLPDEGKVEGSTRISWESLDFTFDKKEVCSKGCLAASWSRGGIDLCVVNAHLEAGHGKLSVRNGMQGKLEARYPRAPRQLLVEVGDLNYRLEASGDFTEPTKAEPEGSAEFNEEFEFLVRCCEAGDSAKLTNRCQLLQARASGAAFVGFEEAELTFAPTYKREPVEEGAAAEATGAPRYDRQHRRLPAWCDRVLWRPGDDLAVSTSHYAAVESAVYSDHRPVHAILRVSGAASRDAAPGPPPS